MRDLETTPQVMLAVRFRLRFIGSSRLGHALFRFESLFNTLLFAAHRGFHSKLWLTDPTTDYYRGIYEWEDEESAIEYAETLRIVLAPWVETRVPYLPDHEWSQSARLPGGSIPISGGRGRSLVFTSDGKRRRTLGSMRCDTEILVVGAGPTGLDVALQSRLFGSQGSNHRATNRAQVMGAGAGGAATNDGDPPCPRRF